MRWDDEDRQVGETLPSGQVGTFTYNGLGLRVGKTDSTGTYSYACDGASPGSPVLSDGHALYTPGLSESRGGVSTYAASDVLGNLWFMDNGSGQQTYYQDTTGFGTVTAQAGSGSPFGYGGGSGCQTDADTGVVLMGHRYYDTRIGRFISQDPAGDGDNWYEYADNSPTNAVDPMGLAPMDGPGSSPMGSPGYSDGAMSGSAGAMDEFGMNWQRHLYLEYEYQTPGVTWLIYGAYWTPSVDLGGGSPGAGMFAAGSEVGDNFGNLAQALAPHAPKKLAKAAAVVANVAAASGSAKAAKAALQHYSEKKAAANAFKYMATATAKGLTRSLGAEALGALGAAGVGVAAEGIAAWSAGWETGTAISNAPLGPGGQTVTDFWSDQLTDSGLWMQQHTSFGH